MPNNATLSFIQKHREDDTRILALKSHPSDVDMQYALEQIAGWQMARKKLPTWAGTEGMIYPPHLSMEQCSSEQTAIYKRELALRLSGKHGSDLLVDLTGGFGVDFSYMAHCFKRAIYVERQQNLCSVASNNMPLLGLENVEIRCADAVESLALLNHASLIFLDPARRDSNGGRTFAIADCTPDVMSIKDDLLAKSDNAIVKLSPMLDWHKAVEDLDCVAEVHIVSVRNECKELLLVLNKEACGNPPRLFCVDCDVTSSSTGILVRSSFEFSVDDIDCSGEAYAQPLAGMYLYEPNSSVMKAGCFVQLSSSLRMSMVSENSHLFLSERLEENFPGRCFVIKSVMGMNKKELRKALSGISKANIATRNFPLSVAELRKRLKLGDGGAAYIFATTLLDGSHVLLLTEKIGNAVTH